MTHPPHSDPADEVLADSGVDESGLSTGEASERRAAHGPNEIARGEGRSPVGIFLAQFDSWLIWVLLAAAALSVWAGHAVDAVLIAVIVVANGVFGFVQDYRAERSLESLRELTAPTAVVRRDGETVEVAASELVPGDVVELSDGDVVPADGRLVGATGLEVDEAALTGESLPVSKGIEPVDADAPLAERSSMVYKSTAVTRGKAAVVVTATGEDTEVGAIARQLAATEETETPLQAELDDLGRTLGLGVVGLAALVVPLLWFRGVEPLQTALTAISLAVAAVPEGLPAVVTLTLALGVRRMADENALVRRLPAVEALGAVDVVCTDKTGTLTEGRMAVSRLWVDGGVVDFDEVAGGAEGDGSAAANGGAIAGVDSERDGPPAEGDRVDVLLRAGALCNDATPDEGDPTERALVAAAAERGFDVERIRAETPRTDEIPFSSERKWMGTVHGDRAYVKGAPEVVVEKCSRVLTDDGPVELDEAGAERIAERTREFADDALRVLAVAYTEDGRGFEADGEGELDGADDLEDLVFVGLVGMLDPPRAEVADAIERTRRAGIDVTMITGDNVRTAAAIGAELGLGGDVVGGGEIEGLSDDELRRRVTEVDVFARASPEHKVRVLGALQANDRTVAMTGDGVNDAPALKNADVGVAMGVRGTDVAKQASDVVLLDDNYATIARAVERGRAIFDNVWKFVAYLLSANVAEVAIVFLASLWGYLVLPAVQLLWINLLTDGLPALALGADPESGDVMERPPRDPDQGIVDRSMLGVVGGTGVVTTAVMLGLLALLLDGAAGVSDYVRTMIFTTFVVLEFGKLFVVRWLRETPTLSNRWLFAAVAGSLTLQLAVLYTPLGEQFETVALGVGDWGIVAGVLGVTLPAYLLVAVGVRRLRDVDAAANASPAAGADGP
ncbi:cation-translocating P-type ATPase [Halosimplex litoreum]|uniref:Cation-translocating P-type ATPase n=1 Tax=Halosimplex litoreum TaxID=1198301 RepID=A0A7T3G0T0_9EURY|nr:cation-translocating P-type ATPase [Halosimplex litoreum]QPV64279.1 cation-translocating P-type ATPase [Halosimplex litoreum]